MENLQPNKKNTAVVRKQGIKMLNKNCTAEIEYTIIPHSEYDLEQEKNIVLDWKVDFYLKNITDDSGWNYTSNPSAILACMYLHIDRKPNSDQTFREPNDLVITITDIKAKDDLLGTGIGTIFWELMLCDIVGMYLKSKNLNVNPNIFIIGRLSTADNTENQDGNNSRTDSDEPKKGGWNSSFPFYLKIGKKTLDMFPKLAYLHARTAFVKPNGPNKETIYDNVCGIDDCGLTKTEIENYRDELISKLKDSGRDGQILIRLYR